jgi:hypothetical protein
MNSDAASLPQYARWSQTGFMPRALHAERMRSEYLPLAGLADEMAKVYLPVGTPFLP